MSGCVGPRSDGYDPVDIPGEKSQFDVLADGQIVFSKQQAGRHAEQGEVLAALQALS